MQVCPSLELAVTSAAVTVYPVTGDPPKPEAVHETVAEVVAAAAMTFVGASGALSGMTPAESADLRLLPLMLAAVTVKVYEVPLVRPVTVQESAAVAHVWPLLEVTV